MINRVRVRNYQSLKNVDIELGRLTIITGDNSKGKSSFKRALQMLVSNEIGCDYVTRGEKVASVTAETEWGSVTIERGDKHGEYRLLKDGREIGPFTALGLGKVPEQITKALRIQPVKDSHSINFEDEHDPPFLLKKSGAEVAKILGELTNVSVIFEAQGEANKRRKNAGTKLKTRESDLANLITRAQEFKGLKAQIESCDAAEEALKEAESLSVSVDRLRDLLADLTVAEDALSRAQDIPEVPDISELEMVYEQHNSFTMMFTQLKVFKKEMAESQLLIDSYVDKQTELHAELHQLLVDIGICPTCEQEIAA